MNLTYRLRLDGGRGNPYVHEAVYEGLEAAQAAATALRAWLAEGTAPATVAVVDAPCSPAWRWRERDRLLGRRFLAVVEGQIVTGEYKALPWAQEPWAADDHERDLYAHVSGEDPTKVAYTKCPNHGAQDRQTRVKPSKYLQEHYPFLPKAECDRWASIMAAHGEATRLQITTDADRIEWVYLHGPGSCMAHEHPVCECGRNYCVGEWYSSQHPVRVYAKGDLAIAYALGGNGRVAARAVVWPDIQQHGRIYGDECLLGELLAKAGYTAGSLAGALIGHTTDGDGVLMPYIDGVAYAQPDSDSGLLCLNDSAGYQTDTCFGVATELIATCAVCGAATDQQDMEYVLDRDVDDDRPLCRACYNETYAACDDCGGVVERDDGRLIAGAAEGQRLRYLCDNCSNAHKLIHAAQQEKADFLVPAATYAVCDDCSRVGYRSDGGTIHRPTGDTWVCCECEADYPPCSLCGRTADPCEPDNTTGHSAREQMEDCCSLRRVCWRCRNGLDAETEAAHA